MIKPLADKIVIKRLAADEKTASGIILPDTAQEKPEQGEVVAVGKDVKEVKVGSTVVFSKYSPTEIKASGIDYLVIKEEDVLVVV